MGTPGTTIAFRPVWLHKAKDRTVIMCRHAALGNNNASRVDDNLQPVIMQREMVCGYNAPLTMRIFY